MSVVASIVDPLFSLYILVLLVRGLLTLVHADFYNVLCQFVFRITEPPLSYLRPLVGSWGSVDWSCWIFAFLLEVLRFLTLSWLFDSPAFTPGVLLPVTLIYLTERVINIYMFSLVILAVSSWFITPIQRMNNPLLSILHAITEPLLRPVRRAFSITGPIDFSVLIVFFLLYIMTSVLQLLLFFVK